MVSVVVIVNSELEGTAASAPRLLARVVIGNPSTGFTGVLSLFT